MALPHQPIGKTEEQEHIFFINWFEKFHDCRVRGECRTEEMTAAVTDHHSTLHLLRSIHRPVDVERLIHEGRNFNSATTIAFATFALATPKSAARNTTRKIATGPLPAKGPLLFLAVSEALPKGHEKDVGSLELFQSCHTAIATTTRFFEMTNLISVPINMEEVLVTLDATTLWFMHLELQNVSCVLELHEKWRRFFLKWQTTAEFFF